MKYVILKRNKIDPGFSSRSYNWNDVKRGDMNISILNSRNIRDYLRGLFKSGEIDKQERMSYLVMIRSNSGNFYGYEYMIKNNQIHAVKEN